jgi:hypothetical protein
MEDAMSTIEITYARFELLEEQLAHCYFQLHERFIHNPQLAAFWTEAAMDELQHSSLLRYCREHGIMSDVEIDWEAGKRVQELLDQVSNIISNPDVTMDDAFYASLLIESSEIDDVFAKLTQPLSKDHRILHEAISASLRLHHNKFAEAADEFLDDQAYGEAFRTLGQSL